MMEKEPWDCDGGSQGGGPWINPTWMRPWEYTECGPLPGPQTPYYSGNGMYFDTAFRAGIGFPPQGGPSVIPVDSDTADAQVSKTRLLNYLLHNIISYDVMQNVGQQIFYLLFL